MPRYTRHKYKHYVTLSSISCDVLLWQARDMKWKVRPRNLHHDENIFSKAGASDASLFVIINSTLSTSCLPSCSPLFSMLAFQCPSSNREPSLLIYYSHSHSILCNPKYNDGWKTTEHVERSVMLRRKTPLPGPSALAMAHLISCVI